MNIDVLAAHEEIRQLVARFTDAVNRADYELFRSAWTPDCTWEFKPPMQMVAQGVDAATQTLQSLWQPWEFFVHLVYDGTIHVAGSQGTARWYIREMARSKDHTRSYRNVGLYQDEMTKIDGVWRFSKRTYQYIWLDEGPFGGKAIPLDPSLPGLASPGGEHA